MASPIPVPLLNGYRHAFSSVEFNFNGQIFTGVKSLNYARTRSRAKVMGNHPDPIGKTRGENDYTCDAEIYFAEFMLFMRTLKGDANGAANGYGDVFFNIKATYGETWFDTVTDVVNGCTLDTTEVALAQGTDPLTRKFTTNPLKILFGQVDDVTNPLGPPPGG